MKIKLTKSEEEYFNSNYMYESVAYNPVKTTYCSQKQRRRSKPITMLDSGPSGWLVSTSASDLNNLIFNGS